MKYLLLLICFNGFYVISQSYKDSTLSIDLRVKDLVERMTLEEKFWQVFMIPSDGDTTNGKFENGIFGLQVSAGAQNAAGGQLLNYNTSQSAKEVAQKINDLQTYFTTKTRLGIPIIPFDEALHGLVRQGATAFPQAIGLAATWDTELVKKVATQIAFECKSRGIRQILSPVVNLATDVRWGRTEETYGEDPFLTAEIGTAFISSFESNGVIATPKHFVANVGEGGRDSYPIYLSDWYLNQSHFEPFIKVIDKGHARSIMTSYNSLNGIACSSNDWLLNQKLKKDWGFKGFVISDANAVGGEVVLHNTAKTYAESGAHAINGGLDVIFQTDYNHAALFFPAFEDGLVNIDRLNDAVSRVLRAKFELGLFDNPFIPLPVTSDAGKAISQEAAEKSFVLLKNNEAILPLTTTETKIALFGWDAAHVRLGGYSGPGNEPISIFDGLKETFPNTTYLETVCYSDTLFKPIPVSFLKHKGIDGLKARYYSTIDFTGKPVLERTDAQIDFSWTLFGPDETTGNHFYSVEWEGEIIGPETGTIELGLSGNDGYQLFINDELVIDRNLKASSHSDLVPIKLIKGKAYPIRIRFYEPKGNGNIELVWNYGIKNTWYKDLSVARKLASKADVAIVVAGIREGEFQDRASLQLPGNQEELIKALKGAGKPVIVLLVGGSAVTMNNWIESADAIACLWYPGEAGGTAVANLISGKINPGGKLPITFPLSEAQLPLTYNHLPTGRSDDYYNLSGEPLFPFGFGLSYSTFKYSSLNISKDTVSTHDSTTLTVTITNTSNVAGDEVVQLYLKPLKSTLARPILSLKDFSRIHLNAGESKTLTFSIHPDLFSATDIQSKTFIETGTYELLIGSSSRDLRLMKQIVVTD